MGGTVKDEKKVKIAHTVRCMYTNLRSIMNKEKKDELLLRMTIGRVDILAVMESWTHPEIGAQA